MESGEIEVKERTIEQLTAAPDNGVPRVYVTIHKGCGGWNSSVWGWYEWTDAEHLEHNIPAEVKGFYEPIQTGFTNTSLGTGQREDAIAEARHWAECDELPLWIPEQKEEECTSCF